MNTSKSHNIAESLPEKVNKLFDEQLPNWPLAKQNYAGLKKVKSKDFDFGDFQVKIQFNPERIRSSAAKVDAKSISERPCFLCEKNRPSEQISVNFKENYSILINPFPIFEKHLTISLNDHVPQEIETYFSDMLELSQQLPDFTIFYNGSKCGASAPDHFHFQAVGKNQLPVETEIRNLPDEFYDTLIEKETLRVQAVRGKYLRKVLMFSSNSKEQLEKVLLKIIDCLKERGQEDEPMMNVITIFEDGQWTVFVFPRDLQRPSQYFEEDEKQIVMSPASVEMGGMVILPREKDFEKITMEDLADIYNQVTINDHDFDDLIRKLKE